MKVGKQTSPYPHCTVWYILTKSYFGIQYLSRVSNITYGQQAHSLVFQCSPPLLHEGHNQGAQVVLIFIVRHRESHKKLWVVYKSFQKVSKIIQFLEMPSSKKYPHLHPPAVSPPIHSASNLLTYQLAASCSSVPSGDTLQISS